MLLSNCLTQPPKVWEATKTLLCEDMMYIPRSNTQVSVNIIRDSDRVQAGLAEIEDLLRKNGKSLGDYPGMLKPTNIEFFDTKNHLVLQELNYDRDVYESESVRLRQSLTDEQRCIYNEILQAKNSSMAGFFFVYGFGGTGKTFLWNALTATIRAAGEIVINVASRGIAATLLPSGRTAHSRFAIPIDINEDSTCNITHNSALSNLIIRSSFIIWDEAPMVRRYCIESVDRTFRDIMKKDEPFGGECVVLGGDFRQILPVISKGGRAEVVNASINYSSLWSSCKIFKLTRNMRLTSCAHDAEHAEIKLFFDWLLSVGSREVGLPHDGVTEIKIPHRLLILRCRDPLKEIISSTYPDFQRRLNDSNYLNSRAILTPRIEVVDQINELMCSMIDGEIVEYLSSDNVSTTNQDNMAFQELYTTEFLNTINCSGLPPHRLRLKVVVPIMLIRNIDQSAGLVNGTRLRVTFLGKHFLKAVALNGTSAGQEFLIHRMDMNPSECKLPFTMTRRQFPIILSFAMTINKSQGQSMSNVGLYLPSPVFTHGQLYVALSRVKRVDGLKILILGQDKLPTDVTTNVVYREIFQNIEP